MATGKPRPVNRFITTNNVRGQAVFLNDTLGTSPTQQPSPVGPDGMALHFCYGSPQVPINLTSGADIEEYKPLMQTPPELMLDGGTTVRIVDFPPGYVTAMHRSENVSINSVIEGEVEVELDSGERQVLKQGDVLVQRAVNHLWRNLSQERWARISAVAMPIVKANGAE